MNATCAYTILCAYRQCAPITQTLRYCVYSSSSWYVQPPFLTFRDDVRLYYDSYMCFCFITQVSCFPSSLLPSLYPSLSLFLFSFLFQSAWKKQEDKQLMKVAKKHDFCNWALIAADLGVSSNLPFGACPVMVTVSL